MNYRPIEVCGRRPLSFRLPTVILPPVPRELVITPSPFNRYLLVYSLNQWEPLQEELSKAPWSSLEKQRIARVMIGHATDIEMSSDDWLYLPRALARFADVSWRFLILPVNDRRHRLQLWNPERYHASLEGDRTNSPA